MKHDGHLGTSEDHLPRNKYEQDNLRLSHPVDEARENLRIILQATMGARPAKNHCCKNNYKLNGCTNLI